MAPSHIVWSETTAHRSFLCMEEGNLSSTMAFDCGQGDAQEEYTTKKETCTESASVPLYNKNLD